MGGNFSFTPELVKIYGPVYPDFTILIQAREVASTWGVTLVLHQS